ncbi:MAG TPA: protein kinase, partial [Ruminococcus sp.]|nr:protein kinase [Ruminococcus sp.]
FTGYGSSVTTSLMSSPEFTTNGMLPKCWRRVDGRILLYKGGTSGASNSGNEPYSEFYAAQIAQTLGIRAIPYGLSNWKGELCSTCELFTSKEYAFLPVGRLVTRGGMAAVREYYQKLGAEYVDALNDMLVLDAVICNTDRHYGNFGLLIDNHTNQITAPAPLFDHGNSLFNFAVGGDLQDADSLAAYADSLVPAVYDDFIGTAKAVMTKRHRDALRKLLNFRFKRHPRYNLPDERMMLIEKEVQRRARLLLDE